MHENEIFPTVQQVLSQEAQAILDLGKQVSGELGKDIVRVCRALFHCKGRIAITGVGKSGHIARKIAATLSSTGSPAFFLHPTDAGHGDMGMICRQDTVLIISHSGEAAEVCALLPFFSTMDIPILAITGNPASKIAKASNASIALKIDEKACPLGLAPMASTTATLAIGDAIAVVLMRQKRFSVEDFARSHPSGKLGKKLILRISDVMLRKDDIPCVTPECHVLDALYEMSSKRLGMTLVTTSRTKVHGIFTDGDLRRTIDTTGSRLSNVRIGDIMTKQFLYFSPTQLAQEAMDCMSEQRIQSAPVLNDKQMLVGAIHMHILLKIGLSSVES